MCKCVFCIVLKAENKDFNKKKFVIVTSFQGRKWAPRTFLLHYNGRVVNILGFGGFFVIVVDRLSMFYVCSPE